MKRTRMFTLCIGLLLPTLTLGDLLANPPEAPEGPPVTIAPGEQRLLKIAGLARYSLGGDGVRISTPPKGIEDQNAEDSEYLLIKGIRPAESDLWVWKKDGSSEHRALHVVKAEEKALKPGLAAALNRLQECEVYASGTGVILRGQVHTLAESARISALVRGFPPEVVNETELTLELLESGRTRVADWLSTSGYSQTLRAERYGHSLWLRGSLPKAVERGTVEREARALFPEIQLEISSLPDGAPTVHFRVYLLELKRKDFGSLGLSWPAMQEGAFHISSVPTLGLSDALQIDVALQALEGKGSVKILSKPELVVRAPGEAELFAGGEIPIKTESQFHSEVTWKPYGLTLHLKVTHTAGDQIRLDIATEVSELDSTIGIGQIPGMQANRMKTEVDARFGVPLFLSGLLQQGMREEARGLPFLRRLPVLGALFGSKDYLNEESELVAILLPSAAPPPAPMEKVREKGEPQQNRNQESIGSGHGGGDFPPLSFHPRLEIPAAFRAAMGGAP